MSNELLSIKHLIHRQITTTVVRGNFETIYWPPRGIPGIPMGKPIDKEPEGPIAVSGSPPPGSGCVIL